MIFKKKSKDNDFSEMFLKGDYKIVDFLTNWIRILNTDGDIIYENNSLIRSCGNNIGKNIFEGNINIIEGTLASELENKECLRKEIRFRDETFLRNSKFIYNDNNEIIAILEDFRNITVEVISIKKYEEITSRNQRELEEAKKIQKAILPQKGYCNSLSINYRYIPSRFLSGDMFDIIKIDDDKIGIYIADVVGHGVSSSLITMFIRQTMKDLINGNNIYEPNILLCELTARFAELNLDDDQYFTIFYGVFSKSKNEFKFANAGHNAIPIKKSGNGEIELVQAAGLPISLIFAKGEYSENVIDLRVGDKILFYTDGITETKDYFNEEYGIERIIMIMEENDRNILDNIINSVVLYRWGNQKDDIAILLIERLEEDYGN